MSNVTTSALISDLIPFTQYLFTIEAFNSVGCVSSSNSITSNHSRIQTLPDIPEDLEPLTLSSQTSYSIEISWSPPLKPNGIISHFILERKDFSPPLSMQLNSLFNGSTNDYKPKIKRYRFEGDKREYADYDDLEACGVYSYRLLAFNQVE